MKHYEIILLIHPSYSEQADEIGKRCRSSVTDAKGIIHRYENIGRLPLAYLINSVRKAYFLLLNIECDQETHKALVDVLKRNDAVMRHLVLKVDRAITGLSALMKRKQEEDKTK